MIKDRHRSPHIKVNYKCSYCGHTGQLYIPDDKPLNRVLCPNCGNTSLRKANDNDRRY